jgi:hypothetical protein
MGGNNAMKRIYMIILAVVVLMLSSPAVFGEDYDDYVIDVYLNNNDCPLQIVDWNAWYRTKDTITFGDAWVASEYGSAPRVREAGFQYDMRLKHNGSKEIIAFQVNVVVFSAFEEYLDTFGIFQGAVLKPGKDITRKNLAVFNGDNQFLTFFLWVDKVRDVDGNLFFADLDEIKSSIEKKMGMEIPIEYLEAGTVQEINQKSRFRERVHVDVY